MVARDEKSQTSVENSMILPGDVVGTRHVRRYRSQPPDEGGDDAARPGAESAAALLDASLPTYYPGRPKRRG